MIGESSRFRPVAAVVVGIDVPLIVFQPIGLIVLGRCPRQQIHRNHEEHQKPGPGQRADDRTQGGTRTRPGRVVPVRRDEDAGARPEEYEAEVHRRRRRRGSTYGPRNSPARKPTRLQGSETAIIPATAPQTPPTIKPRTAPRSVLKQSRFTAPKREPKWPTPNAPSTASAMPPTAAASPARRNVPRPAPIVAPGVVRDQPGVPVFTMCQRSANPRKSRGEVGLEGATVDDQISHAHEGHHLNHRRRRGRGTQSVAVRGRPDRADLSPGRGHSA
jgi:hypothetical protein